MLVPGATGALRGLGSDILHLPASHPAVVPASLKFCVAGNHDCVAGNHVDETHQRLGLSLGQGHVPYHVGVWERGRGGFLWMVRWLWDVGTTLRQLCMPPCYAAQ